MRDILRIGAYEIAFSDGAPDHAVVDQAVRQARALRGPKSRASARAGVVNAVMRRIASDAGTRLATLEGGGTSTAALRFSMPDWIAERLVDSLGAEDAMRVMEAADEPAESAMRWNPLRGPRVGLEAELPDGWHRDPLLPEAYVVPGASRWRTRGRGPAAWRWGRAAPPSWSPWTRGRASACSICARRPGPRRPRWSRSRAAARASRRSSCGPRARSRCGRSRAAWARRSRSCRATRSPSTCPRAASTPCWSTRRAPGLGVLSSRPDARWRRREEALEPLTRLQADLLARALALVRPGGRVVYSTCTLISAENEDVVASVGAPLEDLSERFPGYAHPRVPGALLTLPHRHGTDGFFIARLRRPGAQG